EAVRLDERGAADLPADGRFAFERQELLEAPHVVGPQLDLFARHRLGDGVVVVIDFERAEIFGTEVDRRDGVSLAAQTTFETADKRRRHGPILRLEKGSGTSFAWY